MSVADQSNPAMPPSRPRAVRLRLALGCLIALVPLAWLDPEHRQMLPLAGWLTSMLLYLLLWPRPRSSPRWRPPAGLVIVFSTYVVVLFVAFCFIYDNWRWATTGDSLGFYQIGEEIAQGNTWINPLNVQGVWQQFTVVQATLQNAFMNVSISLFTHRLGNLLTSLLLVIAAASLARQTSGTTAAVLVALFLPLNSVFDVFTLVSYPNLSGVLPYYAAYTLFLAAWGRRDSDFLWAALGLTCGLAVYFPPLWLAAVGLVSFCVVASALHRGSARPLLVWAGGVIVAGAPALVQLRRLINIWFVFRPTELLTLDYFLRIAWQAARLPLGTSLGGYGSDGAWLRPPFGYLFLGGVALAIVSGIQALRGRPRSRALQCAWLWPVLLGSDIIGLSLANSGYPTLSLKRAIVMLPSMTYFAVLPLAWITERLRRNWTTVTLTVLAFIPYAYLNVTCFWNSEFGFDLSDGLVQVAQTAPGQVLLVSPNPDWSQVFGQNGDRTLLQRMYRIQDHTTVTADIPGRRDDFDQVVCFSALDGEDWAARVRTAVRQLCPEGVWQPINTQLECWLCPRG